MSSSLNHRLPFATALRDTLVKGYSWRIFRKDLIAAFIVSLVAMPLSMALAIAVGLPPQHGLYTAIVAGILVPLLGGARLQVSGPTAAFVVILAPIVTAHGLQGLIWCELLAGVFLLIFAALKLGAYIEHVPEPVTLGFTAGIGVILGVISLNDLFGMGLNLSHGRFPEKLVLLMQHSGTINPHAAIVGIVALLLMVYGQKVTRFVPGTILALLASTALSLWFDHTGHFVNTIASQFSYTAKDGAFIPGIPPYPPTLHLAPWPGFAEWTTYIVPALFIAFLAALESLLSATIADSMTGDKHDSNAELWGIGFGNIASGLCAGIPATGAIARTSALINNHGQTPIASTMHAIFIFIYMMLLAHWIGYVPMPALAAILICAAYRMSHWRQCVALLRARNRQNSLVLLVTFALTISIDMVVGVGSGLVLALVLKRLSRASSTANK